MNRVQFASRKLGALHELTKNVGVRLPEYLGTYDADGKTVESLIEHLQKVLEEKKAEETKEPEKKEPRPDSKVFE